jgi:hypothetical protein
MKAARFLRPLLPAFAVVSLVVACRAPTEDPARIVLRTALHPEEKVLALRVLDPDTGRRVVVIVATPAGKPELRIYAKGETGGYAMVHHARQGDQFRNLVLEDVNADGQEEILVTSSGGHLEVLEVITRREDGSYATLFQNAGREIERRYGPAGTAEFWITSRTYEEQPGQPPNYATTVYRWEGDRFTETKAR